MLVSVFASQMGSPGWAPVRFQSWRKWVWPAGEGMTTGIQIASSAARGLQFRTVSAPYMLKLKKTKKQTYLSRCSCFSWRVAWKDSLFFVRVYFTRLTDGDFLWLMWMLRIKCLLYGPISTWWSVSGHIIRTVTSTGLCIYSFFSQPFCICSKESKQCSSCVTDYLDLSPPQQNDYLVSWKEIMFW